MGLFSREKKIEESGILTGLTDYHSHLLPDVDDGIGTIDESLKTLALMENAGISSIWLTPHIMEDMPNKTDDLKLRFDKLCSEYHDGKIRLHLAAEYMLDTLFERRLKANDLLTFDEGRILVETSYVNPPMNMDSLLHDIMSAGFTPILAHPERFEYMTMNDYRRYKEQGLLFQLNIPSLIGAYGKTAKSKANKLLDCGFYNLSGLDIHSIRSMNFFLQQKLAESTVKKIELFK